MSKKSFLDKAVTMPPLRHSSDKCEKFDIMESEVAKWLISQPETAQYVVGMAIAMKAIVFDPTTKTWKGSGLPVAYGFTDEEVLKAVGDSHLKSIAILARCVNSYGRECGSWYWALTLRKLVEAGKLAKTEDKIYFATRR